MRTHRLLRMGPERGQLSPDPEDRDSKGSRPTARSEEEYKPI